MRLGSPIPNPTPSAIFSCRVRPPDCGTTVTGACVMTTTGSVTVWPLVGLGRPAVVEGIGSGCVGGGSLIIVGLATGPEQISPMRQHPIMPLLARTQ